MVKIIVHTMEYTGGGGKPLIKPVNYIDSDFEIYKENYNKCFSKMRQALELKIECCPERKSLLNNRDNVYIYKEKNRFIGAVTIRGNVIDDLIVSSEFQRRGYGEKLLRYAISNIREINDDPIILEAADWNKGAIKLYEKNGFKITNTRVVN